MDKDPNDNKTHYTNVLLENLDNKINRVLEIVASQPTREEFQRLEEKVDHLDRGMQTVKAAVTDTSHQVHNHEQRITELERA
jgi:predicted  nucleic acid-binding Zn-ribbon protein